MHEYKHRGLLLKELKSCASWVPVPFCCGEAGQAWFTALNHLPFPRCWLLSPVEYLPHPFIVENFLFLLVFLLKTLAYLKPPRWLSGKEPACQCRRYKRCTWASWLAKIPGGGTGYPLWSSCLENLMGRGDSQATVYGVAKNWTQLSN